MTGYKNRQVAIKRLTKLFSCFKELNDALRLIVNEIPDYFSPSAITYMTQADVVNVVLDRKDMQADTFYFVVWEAKRGEEEIRIKRVTVPFSALWDRSWRRSLGAEQINIQSVRRAGDEKGTSETGELPHVSAVSAATQGD